MKKGRGEHDKSGGYTGPAVNPADVGKPSPLGMGGSAQNNVADQSLAPGTQDFGKTQSGRGGSLPVQGSKGTQSGKVKNVKTPRHLRTGTARGKGGSRKSGARYTGQSGGGYTPGFDNS